MFAKSREGCELVYRYAREGLGCTPRAGRADRALPRRLHARATAPIERGWARGGCWAWSPPAHWSWGSTSACWTARSRSASRGRCRAPPAVGPGRPPRSRPGLLVAGEDQLDQYFARHADELLDRPPRPPCPIRPTRRCWPPTCAARRPSSADRRRPRALRRRRAGAGGVAARTALRTRPGSPTGRRPSRRPASRCARRSARCSRDRRGRDRHAAGPGGRRPGRLHRAPGRRLPAPGRAVPGARARPGAGSRWWSRSTATTTPRPGACPRPRILRSETRELDGAASATAHRGARAGGRLPAQAAVRPQAIDLVALDTAGAAVRHGGGLVRARRPPEPAALSARCTRPSTP